MVNAVLGFLQEGKAQKALALLRQQLHVEARVRRDGQWNTIGAEELVPDDLIHLRQGTIVPADVRVCDGSLLVDQSALTGESAAVPNPGRQDRLRRRNGAGRRSHGRGHGHRARTFFGKTAELVRTAHAANRQEHEIVRVVRDLFVLNAGMIVFVFGVRSSARYDARTNAAAGADDPARLHSGRVARHLHARGRARIAGAVEARRV